MSRRSSAWPCRFQLGLVNDAAKCFLASADMQSLQCGVDLGQCWKKIVLSGLFDLHNKSVQFGDVAAIWRLTAPVTIWPIIIGQMSQ
jgi:hypothetical protein